jgi:hypothetical protein
MSASPLSALLVMIVLDASRLPQEQDRDRTEGPHDSNLIYRLEKAAWQKQKRKKERKKERA